MAKKTDFPKEIERAKERLKLALNRLENAVDSRISVLEAECNVLRTRTASDEEAEAVKTLKQQIRTLTNEISHIREENLALTSMKGKEHEEYRALKKQHQEIASKVDVLVKELETVLR